MFFKIPWRPTSWIATFRELMPEAIMFSSRINLLWPETSQALLDLALGVLPGYCDKRDGIALIR